MESGSRFIHTKEAIDLAYILVREYEEHERVQDRFNNHRNIWHQMKSRCNNPQHVAYKNYGGRGIRVCARWMNSMSDFQDDMGPRPSLGHSIDRIDNDGHYEPDNCRWATAKQQSNNRRCTNHVT